MQIIDKYSKIIKSEGVSGIVSRFKNIISRKISPESHYHQIESVDTKKDVLFVSGEPKEATSFYRCEIPSEQLLEIGVDSDIIYYKNLSAKLLKNYKHIIWYRVPLTKEIDNYLDLLKEKKKEIIFSIDDLIFDKKSLKSQDWFQNNLNDQQRDEMLTKAEGYLEFINRSSKIIVTTEELRKHIQEFSNSKILILRNGFAKSSLEVSSTESETFSLGFFSGSETHDKNFEIISDTVERLLGEYPELHLQVGSRLRLPNSLNKYQDRIIIHKFIPFNEYLEVLSSCSIILCPLFDNAHNRSKSEIRIIQAGLVGKPVIASNTPAYNYLVENGKNGFLIYNQNEWYSIIKRLLENKKEREVIGNNLKKDILEKYNHKKWAKLLNTFLKK